MKVMIISFEKTLRILKTIENAWTNWYVHNIAEDVYNNPYMMLTERRYLDYDGEEAWDEIGRCTPPFTSGPVSPEVVNKECLQYYTINDKEYIQIGIFRYILNDAVKALFE